MLWILAHLARIDSLVTVSLQVQPQVHKVGRPVGVSNRVSVTARVASVAGGGGCLLCSSAFVSSVRVTGGPASVATPGGEGGRSREATGVGALRAVM